MSKPEQQSQEALFAWAKNPATLAKYPALDLLSSSLNGVRLTITQAVFAKRGGMLKGEWDVRLPVARGQYIGLIIEMKAGKNTLTKEQKHYEMRMKEEGHYTAVCYDWVSAKAIIEGYLAMQNHKQLIVNGFETSAAIDAMSIDFFRRLSEVKK